MQSGNTIFKYAALVGKRILNNRILLLYYLQLYFPKFHGVGICVVNLVDDSQEYTRGLFFLM